MKVYHGSYTKIDKIDLEKCELGKDFGRGFYVTKIKEQADFWAERKGLRYQTNGCVTEFDFNENAFRYFHLKVLRFETYNDEWLDFVAQNRAALTPELSHEYDIIEGPVADDKIATRIKDYLKGEVTKQDFLEELKFLKTTHQICFCTGRSLQMLNSVENKEDINYKIGKIGEPLVEKLMLDMSIDEIKAADVFYSSATFTQLANPATQLYQKPWQEIYEILKKEL